VGAGLEERHLVICAGGEPPAQNRCKEVRTMKFETVLYKKQGQIVHVTLNRPEKMNALSPELIRDWNAAIHEVEEDDDVKVVVFKGAGRCFSAGMDLSRVGFVYGMRPPKPGESRAPKVSQRVRLKFDKSLFSEFHRNLLLCSKLTVVQMHGYALGVVFNLALQCDYLIAAENCKLGHVEERLGLGGHTISPIMVLRAGFSRAMDLCLTGRMIDGKEAADIGLINKAVPEKKLEAEVMNFAEGIARYPKDGIAFGKASRHLMYESMGITRWFAEHYIMHSFQTNRVYEPDEFNFFKERRDKGVRDAAHEKHDYFKKLDK
jgi:enoyl-CoA hydratase